MAVLVIVLAAADVTSPTIVIVSEALRRQLPRFKVSVLPEIVAEFWPLAER